MALFVSLLPHSSGLLFSPILTALVVLLIVYLAVNYYKRARLLKLIGLIPGPPGLPLVGNAIEVNVDHDEIFERLSGIRQLWGSRLGFCKGWLGTKPYVFISKAECVEPIMGSIKHIEKSQEYYYLHPWLGTGLLTSTGLKWHKRRKILTPAFHFRILDDFIEVFREQSDILVEKLEKEVDKNAFNVFPYITSCTLDVVCETAMGYQSNSQNDKDSDYVKAVYEIGSIVQNRQAKIWLQPDFIFKMSSYYTRHQECIKILHGLSNKIIAERKEEVRQEKENGHKDNAKDEFSILGSKKRLAFLDLLIEASKEGTVLSDEDIREEVDTFMFEGHDTTSAGLCWLLLLLGSNQEVQDRVVAELDSIFEGSDRPFTMKDLNDMKYLECCIKEALRLYPSVPMLARKLEEDVTLGDFLVPSGTTAMIIIYALHRDPNVFKNPEVYNPDNFLPENIQGRHPYSYIPFSAGPRNCIGQKFALLEEKSIASSILRKYRVEAIDRREDLTLLGELILRPKDGIRVKLQRR
ncbi:cytochrome P450 4c3 [Nilaparvata lugens]|uniref:cytochrome P450 4c3 n=1 Tax=Nilaparvata lugens TaxID=108931 RepID=UPI00193D1E17|nr:cytochrome P450 4c3 [Nilaparvata lugens]